MEAIGNLNRIRRSCGLGVRAGAVPHDDLDPGMLFDPRDHGGLLPIGQEAEHAVALEIDEDRPVAPPSAPARIIDADDARRGRFRCERLATPALGEYRLRTRVQA